MFRSQNAALRPRNRKSIGGIAAFLLSGKKLHIWKPFPPLQFCCLLERSFISVSPFSLQFCGTLEKKDIRKPTTPFRFCRTWQKKDTDALEFHKKRRKITTKNDNANVYSFLLPHRPLPEKWIFYFLQFSQASGSGGQNVSPSHLVAKVSPSPFA